MILYKKLILINASYIIIITITTIGSLGLSFTLVKFCEDS